MREFVFELEYETGVNPLIDVLSEHPDVTSKGIDSVVSDENICRIERITGPADGIETAKRCLQQRLGDVETITKTACDVTAHLNILNSTESRRDIHVYFEAIQGGDSIHTIATKHLGTDLLLKVERTQRTQRWRIICKNDEGFGNFYDAFQGALKNGISFRFSHVGQAQDVQTNFFSEPEMPTEQRVALVSAVKHGYYESPREISLETLSDNLGWPRSTLSYRLRQAEAELAEAFVGDADTQDTEMPTNPKQLSNLLD